MPVCGKQIFVLINNQQLHIMYDAAVKNSTYSSFKTLFNEPVVALNGMWCSTA